MRALLSRSLSALLVLFLRPARAGRAGRSWLAWRKCLVGLLMGWFLPLQALAAVLLPLELPPSTVSDLRLVSSGLGRGVIAPLSAASDRVSAHAPALAEAGLPPCHHPLATAQPETGALADPALDPQGHTPAHKPVGKSAPVKTACAQCCGALALPSLQTGLIVPRLSQELPQGRKAALTGFIPEPPTKPPRRLSA